MALNRKHQDALARLLQAGAKDRAGRLVDRLSPADLSTLLAQGAPRVKEALLEVLLTQGRAARSLRDLPESLLSEHLERMGASRLASILSALPADDATSVLELVPEERHREILAEVPDTKREVLEQQLHYAERSAGRLMDPHVLALPVVTRGIALGQDHFVGKVRLVLRQASTSVIIGLVTGVLTAAIAYALRRDVGFSLVLLLAMLINLAFAGFAGAFVPLLLRRLRLDPALGSGVVLTTFTDVVGFVTFLGLATLILRG